MYYLIGELKNITKPGRYPVAENLHMAVRGNARSWVFRYLDPRSKTRRDVYIGPVKRINADQAKETARDMLKEVRQLRVQEKARKVQGFITAKPSSIGVTLLPQRDDTSPLYGDAIVSFMEIKSADLGEKKQLSWVNGLNTLKRLVSPRPLDWSD